MIVGASGVLGAELARQLHSRGAEVLGTASSNDSATRIPATASVRLLLDYQAPESIKTLTDYLNASAELDGIINAAGIVAFGPASELSDSVISRLMAVNAAGPMQLLAALHGNLLKSASRGSEPVVVNLTGVVAEAPLPNLAAYSASKTAIHGFLQGVTREWRRDGIRVLSARPGHTETGLATRAISGTAPAFPQGMTAEAVSSRILLAIEQDEKDLASADF